MDLIDHLGVESASDHHEENASVRLDRVHLHDPSGKDELREFPGIKGVLQALRQNIRRPAGEKRDRNSRFRAIRQFRGRSVPADSDQRTQFSLAMQRICPLCDQSQVGQDLDFKSAFAQCFGKDLRTFMRRTPACFGIQGKDHVCTGWRKRFDPGSILRHG